MEIEQINSDQSFQQPKTFIDKLLRAQTKPNQNILLNEMDAQSDQSQSKKQLRFSINSDDADLQLRNYGVQLPETDFLANLTSQDSDGNSQTAQIERPVYVQVQPHGHDRRFQNDNRRFEPRNKIYMNQSVVHLNMRQLRIQRSAPNLISEISQVNTETKKLTCQCHSRCQRTMSCKCFQNGQSCGPYCGCLNCPDKYCPKKQTNPSDDQQISFDEDFLRESGQCSFEPFQWEQWPI